MAEYERNRVFRSALTGRFYFAPRVRVVSERARAVVGDKYDITDQIAPYLLKRFRPKPAKE